MEIQELLLDKTRYRKTTKKRYDVTITRPRTCTTVHNIFDDTIQTTSSYKPFVVVGPCGEETIAGIGDLLGNYEFSDGTQLTEESLVYKLTRGKGSIKACWVETSKAYWATLIPYTLQHLIVGSLVLNRQSVLLQGVEALYNDCLMAGLDNGDLTALRKHYQGKIVTNTTGSYYIPEHGRGDYLVCDSLLNGEPDLSTARVVNGLLFEEMYDMRSFSTVALEIAFLLLSIYIQDMATRDGVEYSKQYGKITSFLRKEAYQIKIGERQGTIYLLFNKSERNLTAYYEIYGKQYSIPDYNSIRKKAAGRDEVDTLIYYVTSLLSTFKKQLAIAKVELSEDTERLIKGLFNSIERVFDILPGEHTATPTIRADKSMLAIVHKSASCQKPIKVLILARITTQACESAIQFDGKEYDLQTLVPVRNLAEAERFTNEFKSRYVRLINGFSVQQKRVTATLPIKEEKSLSAPLMQSKQISDWHKYIKEAILKFLPSQYTGIATVEERGANTFFKVDNQTVLVISKASEDTLKVMNKTSNVSITLKEHTDKYLVTIARNCVKFSKNL